jgi:hypothetical protein
MHPSSMGEIFHAHFVPKKVNPIQVERESGRTLGGRTLGQLVMRSTLFRNPCNTFRSTRGTLGAYVMLTLTSTLQGTVKPQLLSAAGSRRHLLESVRGVDVATRVVDLDETRAIAVALKLKNDMSAGEVQVMLIEVFPSSEVDYVFTQQPVVTREGELLRNVPVEPAGMIKARGGRGSVRDGAMQYEWTVDKNGRLEMVVTARTKGWVGFGIAASSDGLMVGADLVIGHFKEGQLVIGDYHVAGERALSCPSGVCLDTELEFLDGLVPGIATELRMYGRDNLLSWSGEQVEGLTTIVFSRLLQSDDPFDRSITAGRTTVLLAHGQSNELGYHGSNRVATTIEFVEYEDAAPMASLFSFSAEVGDGFLYWGWEQDPHLASFALVTPVGGYSAVAFSTTPRMVGAKGVAILKADQEHPSLREIELTAQNEEAVNAGLLGEWASDEHLALQSFSVRDGWVTARWTQNLSAHFDTEQDVYLLWSSGAVFTDMQGDPWLKRHNALSRGPLRVNMRSGAVDIEGIAQGVRMRVAHGALMSASFGVFLPAAIIAAWLQCK